MHIPPYHRQTAWQRFFVGMLVGGIVAYVVLVYMQGAMYEELILENIKMEEMISDLKNQNKALLQDQDDRSAPSTVQEIEIIFMNTDAFKNNTLLESQLKSLIKQEINHLIGIEITVLSASDELLVAALENRTFTLDSRTYQFTLKRTTISPILKLKLETKLLN
ncbi:sporulation membrane protein YtrI [Oceanobacillus sp. CAU 1775]